ncbi:MAG TPA: hypothetical protein VEU94_08910 [Terriglobales bacterium]|nr:hypothetical protein [Terriglobales bacterium]
MRSASPKSTTFLLTLLLGASLAPAAFAADKPQTFTGKVSDAMCGANHMMAGSASECVHACIRKGSRYALVASDKVYALDTSDKAVLDQLDKLADEQAKVVGQANGDTIVVSAVAKAK